jgi:hypothetical protein
MHSSDFVHISFLDPGPHGTGRYSTEMLPVIEQRDFRKGAQVHVCYTSSVFYRTEYSHSYIYIHIILPCHISHVIIRTW